MYKRGFKGWMKHIDFIVLDFLCMHASFVLAYYFRHGMWNPYGSRAYLNIAIVFSFIDMVVAVFFESFKNVLKRGYYSEFATAVRHVCLVMMLLVSYLFITQTGEVYSRATFSLMAPIYALSTYIVRILWKKRLLGKKSDSKKRSLLIVTSGDLADTVAANMLKHRQESYCVTGIAVLDRDMVGKKIEGVEVVADRDTVVEYICRNWVDEVFIDLPEDGSCSEELMGQFEEMGVVIHRKLAKASYMKGKKQFVEKLGDYTVLTTSINMASPGQMVLKRGLDILGGLVGCMITAVLFLILAPIIKKKSPGPIFFKQQRVGKNGQVFSMYKFRSMVMDAEEQKQELMEENQVADGMMFKMEYDPRIIGCRKLPDGTVKKGVGNLMRDWSLDEFPQFFNVLKGDMSLVGTRPPTLDEWEKYELKHRARMATKPGITGMWQVSGRSRVTDFGEVVKLDTQYIQEWSMALDFKILLKTVRVVLRKEGAM